MKHDNHKETGTSVNIASVDWGRTKESFCLEQVRRLKNLQRLGLFSSCVPCTRAYWFENALNRISRIVLSRKKKRMKIRLFCTSKALRAFKKVFMLYFFFLSPGDILCQRFCGQKQ